MTNTFFWWDAAIDEAIGRYAVDGVKHTVKGRKVEGLWCWDVLALVEVCS